MWTDKFLGQQFQEQRAAGVDNEIIRLVEEALNVGKRQFETGRTRVRKYVVERPVEAQGNLKSEHAEVIRRVVQDPTLLENIDWADHTIEVIETSEEAVVSKTVRIAEEVVVGKNGTERTETVKDTVRRQQVEAERVPTSQEHPTSN